MATADFTLMKGEGLIRVQRGMFYSGLTTNKTLSIPISSPIPDTSKALVRVLGLRDTMTNNQTYPFGLVQLAGSTSLLVTRSDYRTFNTNSFMYVQWEVSEWSNVRVQRGVFTGELTMGNAAFTNITAVDPAKSEVHCLGIIPNSTSYSSATASYFATLNPSQIGFNCEGSGSGGPVSISWEIATFNEG